MTPPGRAWAREQCAAAAPAASPAKTFHASADVVSIQASVKDKRGRPVAGLTTTDFEVRDNGQPSSILSLRSDRRSPVSVAILVDMSGSMRVGSKIAMVRQSFDSILSQLREDQDELALFTFDTELHERQPFTTDISRLKGALDEFKAFGATSLYDATAATARRIFDTTLWRPEQPLRVVLIGTDFETISRLCLTSNPSTRV